MKRLVVKPSGWPCTLAECPPGLFTLPSGELCVKTDYREGGWLQAYLGGNGDTCWGGAKTNEERERLQVQPCEYVWEEYYEE